MVGAIDVMNYVPLVAPGLAGPEYQYEEFQIMLRTTFKSMASGGTIATLWGRRGPGRRTGRGRPDARRRRRAARSSTRPATR